MKQSLSEKQREMLDRLCTRVLNEMQSDKHSALMKDLNELLQQFFGPLRPHTH